MEVECLRKRGEAQRTKGVDYQVQSGKGNYITWRDQMDKDTRDSCPNFALLSRRFVGGAKTSKAVLNIKQTTQQTLHFHWACSKYPTDQPCDQPTICKSKQNADKALGPGFTLSCPIKDNGEHHDCLYEKELTEDDLISVNIARVNQHQHPVQGSYWGVDNQQMIVLANRNQTIELQDANFPIMG